MSCDLAPLPQRRRRRHPLPPHHVTFLFVTFQGSKETYLSLHNRQKHLFLCRLPLRYATVLCFAASASVRGHGRREATSDRLIASAERPVTIIPLTVGLLSSGRVSLDSRKWRNSSPGIEKKIETRHPYSVHTLTMFFLFLGIIYIAQLILKA